MYACNTFVVAIPIKDYNNDAELRALTVIKRGNKFVYVYLPEYEELLLKGKKNNQQPTINLIN